MKKLLFILLAALTITACTEEDKATTTTTTTITTPDQTQLTQTAYADENTGKNSVNFTTSGAWTSAISEKPAAKSASDSIPKWIIITPASGDKAGDYTINVILGTNYTGEKRTAIITITCNGQTITITVTQEATTKEGEKPEQPLFVKKINGKDVTYDTVAPHIIIVSRIGRSNYINKAISPFQWDCVSVSGDTCYYKYKDSCHISKVLYRIRVSEYHWSSDTLKYIRGDQQNVGREGYLRTDLEYGNMEYTKSNIDINWLLASSEYYTETPASAIGIRTTHTKKLLVKKTQKEELDNGKYNGYSTYRYVFNNDGYITQVYETHISEIIGPRPEKLIYEFEY